ncbi:helix-turn-helix domain-containing protein [Sphingobacterium endophyticum]|uniref:helix-turn-helix domain-containing protein n=1 Tax=Sphingobacterium endophyticum TaxID=2546448 RepID=UPI0012E1FEE8
MSSNIEITRLCDHCGVPFIAKTTVTRFCSKGCNSRFYKQEQKQKKLNASNQQTMNKMNIPSYTTEPASNNFYSIAETCNMLGLSRTTIWRLIKNNRLKVTKIGSRVIITQQEIDRLFK